MQVNKDKVLRIVKRWKIKKRPEYRVFRCALCQRVVRKVWHVWLKKGGYNVEVHFCNRCIEEVKK